MLHGQEKVSKRYLIQVAARNLGLLMRKLFGIGTARGLQGLGAAAARMADPRGALGLAAFAGLGFSGTAIAARAVHVPHPREHATDPAVPHHVHRES